MCTNSCHSWLACKQSQGLVEAVLFSVSAHIER
uniref:Uncharacterized protein n=1 Tax=Anguilla anguilla TaxID=7936 RepID=A0A0E9UW11_ANGAN